MVKKSNICSSVEGEKLKYDTRQFYSKPPVFHEILNRNVYPFKLGINGHVEIVEPLKSPNETAIYDTSLLDKGDEIQGGSVDGWSIKPLKKPSVSNSTGTHSASFGALKGHSYAHVESPHRDHLESADIQSRHPEVIQVLNRLRQKDEVDL